MDQPLHTNGLDEAIESLFDIDDGPPCAEGSGLLRKSALNCPQDFEFRRREDLVDVSTCSLAGIPEWDAFARHFGTRELCNA